MSRLATPAPSVLPKGASLLPPPPAKFHHTIDYTARPVFDFTPMGQDYDFDVLRSVIDRTVREQIDWLSREAETATRDAVIKHLRYIGYTVIPPEGPAS